MTDSPTQHALRELQRIFSLPMAQVILVAVTLLMGISGPFGTSEALPFGPRLAYWAVTVPVTFGIGLLTTSFVARAMKDVKSTVATHFAVAISTGFTVAIAVIVINWFAFALAPFSPSTNFALLFSIITSAGVVAFVLHHISNLNEHQEAAPASTPSILERIDLNKRGALISMSVQDHYVEVTTTAGTSSLLMRLSDAMRETSTHEGLQIHRSHWVARAHVKAAEKQGDKIILTLSDGRTLPASRSHIGALKEAGILAR